MPIIEKSTYKAPFFLRNGHINTIFPQYFRKVKGVNYKRERIFTPDNDFIDLDFSYTKSDKIAVLLHGLEGDSSRHYMLAMSKAFNRRGWDSVSFNFRGCSGEVNRSLRFYHAGATDDVHTVIKHIESTKRYNSISIIGYSLGGNMAIKFFGENPKKITSLVKCGAAISVPCNLETTNNRIGSGIYAKYLLKTLKNKIFEKKVLYPSTIDISGLNNIKTLLEYDDRYTAPINGYENAKDYWEKNSCKQFIKNVSIPFLLINAEDDPFITHESYPIEEAKFNKNFFLEIPKWGGHVGFVSFSKDGEYWMEKRIVDFVVANSK